MRGWLGMLSVGLWALSTIVGCVGEVTTGDEGGGEGGGDTSAGGSGGTGGATGPGTATIAGPSFEEVYEGVLAPRSCTSLYCHASFGGDMHATYLQLLGGVAEGDGCGGAKLVIPGDPEQSMLYLKVSMAKPPCGERMPFAGVVLPAAETDLIRAWIDAGAHE